MTRLKLRHDVSPAQHFVGSQIAHIALVPATVALRRIEAGEFVMLGCGMQYSMDKACC